MTKQKILEEKAILLTAIATGIYNGHRDFADLSRTYGVIKTTKLKLLAQENYIKCYYSNKSRPRLYMDLTKKGDAYLEKLINE